jgi:hypothetical protein
MRYEPPRRRRTASIGAAGPRPESVQFMYDPISYYDKYDSIWLSIKGIMI